MALSTCMTVFIITFFAGIQDVPVQQQPKVSDRGVFAVAFATYLAYGIHPETVQFDVPKMRTHLCKSLNPSTKDGCGEGA